MRLFVDTASDMTLEEARQIGVELIILPVSFDGVPFHQGDAEDFPAFYEEMDRHENLPVSSQPVFGDLFQLFTEVKEAGDEAVYLTISHGISGTYESALKAVQMVGYDKIKIVDSLTCLPAMYLLSLRMVDDAKKGMDAQAIADDLESIRFRAKAVENVSDLTNLRKGGRIPRTLAVIGNLLNLKPFLAMTEDGSLKSPKMDRGIKQSYRSLARHICRYELDPAFPVIIQYTSDPDEIKTLYELVKEELGEDRLMVRQVGAVVGTHLGNKSVGASFILSEAGWAERKADMEKDPKAPYR